MCCFDHFQVSPWDNKAKSLFTTLLFPDFLLRMGYTSSVVQIRADIDINPVTTQLWAEMDTQHSSVICLPNVLGCVAAKKWIPGRPSDTELLQKETLSSYFHKDCSEEFRTVSVNKALLSQRGKDVERLSSCIVSHMMLKYTTVVSNNK